MFTLAGHFYVTCLLCWPTIHAFSLNGICIHATRMSSLRFTKLHGGVTHTGCLRNRRNFYPFEQE